MTGFGTTLAESMARRGHLCVGIDPHSSLLGKWGLSDDLDGLRRFADVCVEAIAPAAAVVKPQSAFFERFGSAGIAVLEQTIAGCRDAGALVLLDVKRGDIGSTMDAYAQSYLADSAPLASDAITVSPYLGVGSLAPALDLADATGRGVFVLALTSNPEGPQLQHLTDAGGRTAAQVVLDDLSVRNAEAAPGAAMGPFGVVVGATIGSSVADLAGFNGPFLVPGIGAQGGTAEDVARIFGSRLSQVLPSSSREVLGAGPDATALRAATERTAEAFAFLAG